MTIDKPNTLYFPDSGRWVLQDAYYDTRARVFIKEGFTYDGASVPRLVWAILDPLDLSEAAPLVHDYLYRHAGEEVPVCSLTDDGRNVRIDGFKEFSKRLADKIFNDIMKGWKVKPWKRHAAFFSVSRFAGFAWRKHLRKNQK